MIRGSLSWDVSNQVFQAQSNNFFSDQFSSQIETHHHELLPAGKSGGHGLWAVKIPLLQQLVNGHPKWTLAQTKQINLKLWMNTCRKFAVFFSPAFRTHRNTHTCIVDFYLRRHFILGYIESEAAGAVSHARFYRENTFLKDFEPLFPLSRVRRLCLCVPSAAENTFPLYLYILLINLPFWVWFFVGSLILRVIKQSDSIC